MSYIADLFASMSDDEVALTFALYEASLAYERAMVRVLCDSIECNTPPLPDWEPIDEQRGAARWARVTRRWGAKHV